MRGRLSASATRAAHTSRADRLVGGRRTLVSAGQRHEPPNRRAAYAMTGPATTSSLPGRRDLLPTLPGLITYPDSLGGDLASIARLLGGPLAGAFASGHVLPPFPASGDRGFAVTDHSRIDPRFGGWSELAAIGRHAAV